MHDNDHGNDEASGLTRRRFVRLSGAAGAGAILVGAGPLAGSGLAAAQPPSGTFDPLCGDPADLSDPIWARAHECATSATPTCPVTTSEYVVLYGYSTLMRPPPTHNFLLVPTERIMGIECPTIWRNPTPNYWQAAWRYAHAGITQVQNVCCGVGLGVNSVHARTFNQLHIHMAGIVQTVKGPLDIAANQGRIASTLAGWANLSRVDITGSTGSTHVYRVLRRDAIDGGGNNPFVLLHQMLLTTGEDMGDQTLIVTRLDSGRNEGFYILNSNNDLTNPSSSARGTNTCDPLLDRDL